jgi:hypothetical protein
MNDQDILKKYAEDITWFEENAPSWVQHDYPKKYAATNILAERSNSTLFHSESMRPKFRKGRKYIGREEIQSENLWPYIDLRKKYRLRFELELKNRIDRNQIKIYQNTLKNWIDGGRSDNPIIINFKKSIHEYLKVSVYRGKYFSIENGEDYNFFSPNYLTTDSIKNILELQTILLEQFFHDADNLLDHDIFDLKNPYLHRGLNILEFDNLNKYVKEKEHYREMGILSSYSLSFNIAEKFSLINKYYKQKIPTNKCIVSSSYDNFYSRVIGSPLLNKELHIRQFEFLCIPSSEKFFLSYEGLNDHIHDFLIDKNFKPYCGGGARLEDIEEAILEGKFDENYE